MWEDNAWDPDSWDANSWEGCIASGGGGGSTFLTILFRRGRR